MMKRLAVIAAALIFAAWPAAAQASSPHVPGSCTAQDASGFLYVTGSMPERNFTYDWGIYDPVPGGYSPETGSGQFTTASDGTFTFTSPQPISYYLAQVPGETTLEFYAEHGEIHSHGYDLPIIIAACSYSQ